MADNTQIEVKFDYKNRESPFGLPRTTEVKRGSRVEWVIKDLIVLEEIYFSKRKFRNGIKFTLYFENSSAFEWRSESLLIVGFPPYFRPLYSIQIASGIAENEGDHKYGLKLVSSDGEKESEPEYDDDPFLRVY